MKAISGKALCKLFEKHGWVLKRTKSSHCIYGRPGNSVIITVPVHGNRDLRIGTQTAIMKQAGLSEADL